MGVFRLYENLKGLDVRVLASQIFESGYIQQAIIDLNTEQLENGTASTGEKILPRYRSVSYALQKARMNPKAGEGVPDLKVTGSFYGNFRTELRSNILSIYSTDSKANDLEQKYKNIYGLTEDNFKELLDRAILPELLTLIRNELLQ